jgi:hypothetical protein
LTRHTGAYTLLTTLVLALILADCTAQTTPPPLTVRTVTRSPEAIVAPTTAPAAPTATQAESPLPAPDAAASPLPTPLPAMPAPAAGMGAVHGVLITRSDHKPYQATLYLGRAIPSNKAGYGPMIAFSEDTEPKGEQDPATGVFQFKDVPPGTYALIIWTPVGNTVIEKPDSKDYLLVDVKAGQINEMGEVTVP